MELMPFVSVILPVHNEESYIESGLYAILTQDYPHDRMEIIVVDGMSSDNTRNIIQALDALFSQINLRILDNLEQIVPTGMNVALQQARGDIIVRVDGHTVIAPNYVRKCVENIQRTHADNVGGRMNAIGNNTFGKTVALATSTPFGIGGGRFHYSDREEWVDTVYMGAWPRRVFEKIGAFDEELVRDQDDEFNYRLRAVGGKILLSPEIKSEYAVRSSPSALCRQYYQYGYWKVRVLQKYPRQMSLRQFVPPAFVLALLVSIFLALFPASRLLSLTIPFFYILANMSASIYTASKRGWESLLYLPLVFAILHLGYGLGFLVGLVKFWNRWSDKVGKTPVWSGEPLG